MNDDIVSLAGLSLDSPLSPAVLRGLSDRSYEKRKNVIFF